jgi:phosphoglycerate dehydrogenase-like enzyme
MRVLYLADNLAPQPWMDSFLDVCKIRHRVTVYDPEKPIDPQFAGIQAVGDIGGSMGTPSLYDAANQHGVKHWQILGTGLDHVNVDHLLRMDYTVSYCPGTSSAAALAEHAFYFMTSFAKNSHASRESIESGRLFYPMNEELHGKTLGLLGFGASARELAKRAWSFGMTIMAIDQADISRDVLDRYPVSYFGGADNLDHLLSESEFFSIHIPLNASTQHLIGHQAFERMKPNAVLLNVARGEIVDEPWLIDALKQGKIRGAGLDVFAQEPLPNDSPLLKMDNVIATAHVVGGTTGTALRRAQMAAESYDLVEKGQPPLHRIKNLY